MCHQEEFDLARGLLIFKTLIRSCSALLQEIEKIIHVKFEKHCISIEIHVQHIRD